VRGRLRQGLAPENFDAMARLVEDGWGQDNPAFRQLMTSLLWPGASAEQMQAFNQGSVPPPEGSPKFSVGLHSDDLAAFIR